MDESVATAALSARERAERYRAFARETLELAGNSSKPELKATYLSLTSCWTSLAREAENAANRAPVVREAATASGVAEPRAQRLNS